MSPTSLRSAGVICLSVAFPLAGCEQAMQDMYDQPRYDPFEPSKLFANGSSARTPPDGALAALTGALAESSGGRRGVVVPLPEPSRQVFPIVQNTAPETGPTQVVRPREVPIALNAATYRIGRERYDIFCAPCHGTAGYGDGMVVRRGFPEPPSYHTDRLRQAPDRHFYDVISHGYGAMYPYADRLRPDERWSVVAYIRALQLSQHAPTSALGTSDLEQLGRDDG